MRRIGSPEEKPRKSIVIERISKKTFRLSIHDCLATFSTIPSLVYIKSLLIIEGLVTIRQLASSVCEKKRELLNLKIFILKYRGLFSEVISLNRVEYGFDTLQESQSHIHYPKMRVLSRTFFSVNMLRVFFINSHNVRFKPHR